MRRREIIGTSVSITDYDEVIGAIEDAIAEDGRIWICCAPASTLVFAQDDGALASALASADIVTPDGMGVVHAARLLGESIDDRVYGPDLMAAQLASAGGHASFLYGGHDEAALTQLEAALAAKFPEAGIAGAWSPPHRDLTGDELDTVVEQINASGAKIVWVGIGSPKQELWMQSLRGRLDAPVLVGVGAAFDFFSGRVAQAPRWMQRASLEWLYRIIRDPIRLGRRYLLTLPRFVVLVLKQRRRERHLR
jgi:N-acetylglucosaminyldiphosphoundecaprenol N-acetyl-beta-D-mannosaminyltransferase